MNKRVEVVETQKNYKLKGKLCGGNLDEFSLGRRQPPGKWSGVRAIPTLAGKEK